MTVTRCCICRTKIFDESQKRSFAWELQSSLIWKIAWHWNTTSPSSNRSVPRQAKPLPLYGGLRTQNAGCDPSGVYPFLQPPMCQMRHLYSRASRIVQSLHCDCSLNVSLLDLSFSCDVCRPSICLALSEWTYGNFTWPPVAVAKNQAV